MTWEKEKAYKAKKAAEFGAQLDEAIATNDREKFEATYQAAYNYMTANQRRTYYTRFLRRYAQ